MALDFLIHILFEFKSDENVNSSEEPKSCFAEITVLNQSFKVSFDSMELITRASV